MAEVSVANKSVAVGGDDERVKWRNYKFIPTPIRKKPRSTCCSTITFGHMSQVAKDGYFRPPLNFEDVYLAPFFHAEPLFSKGKRVLNKIFSSGQRVPLGRFFRDFLALEKRNVILAVSFNFFDMTAEAVRPLILKAILVEMSGERDQTKFIVYSCAMFLASIMVGVGHSQYLNTAKFKLGLRWNATMSSLVFSKLLKSHANTGKSGLNLIVGDAKILAEAALWGFRSPAFFGVIVYSITMLFFELGTIPALAGVITLATLLLLQWRIGSWQAKHQKEKQVKCDERLNLIREMVTSIRGIKFSGWEEQTEERIGVSRSREMKSLLGFRSLWAVNEFLAAIATVGASVVAIITYASLSPTFNISNVFTSIAFFNLLRQPLQFIPLMISSVLKGKISLERIKAYLEEGEKLTMDHKAVPSSADVQVLLKEVSAGCQDTTDGSEPVPVLQGINVSAAGPGLYGIVGRVGSGKSTLLATMLRDSMLYSGEVKVCGTVAYAPQQAWIMNSTIRDNILFGETFELLRYEKVMKACGLDVDILSFPAGDETEIGEQGVNLSGGQKQRLALARCAYSKAQIMLFDDALSALDVTVAKQVFDSLMLGLLKDKTVFFVTHYLHLLSDCTRVFVLENGSVVDEGTYDDLVANGNALLNSYVEAQDMDIVEKAAGQEVKVAEGVQTTSVTVALAKEQKQSGATQKVNGVGAGSAPASKTVDTAAAAAAGKELIVEEHREKGIVTFKTWARYFRSFGGWKYFLGILFSSVLVEASFGLSDWWLTHDEGKSLHIYGIFALVNALANVVRVTLFAFGTVRAATEFHTKILRSVVSAPVLFFDVNPAGRILQRFAGDFFDVEVVLPHFLEHAWLCLSHVVGIVLTMAILAPMTIIGLIPIFVFYFNMQQVYSANNRETKRLQSLSQSPVSSLISEATSGRDVIRAFNMGCKYEVLFFKNFDGFSRCDLLREQMGFWQHIRVQFCGACIAFTACIVCSFSTSAGIAGLVINFSIIINFYLGGWVYLFAESEAFLTSVERIGEYCDMDQEAARYRKDSTELTESKWPTVGKVEFQNVCLRYRKNLPLALKSANFIVDSGMSCGIVGRTGAGKSTLAVALFRLFEAESGGILVDGVKISDLGLMHVRKKLSIVPQNPILFGDTVRKNLDPFDEYQDKDVYDVLVKTELNLQFQKMSNGDSDDVGNVLGLQLTENGSNLSVGTRQLVCLARAMLRRPKVLVLDEATSALDLETDRSMQKMLREQFQGCTVIIVAHRLETVVTCDKIVVMGDGSVIEQGSPEELLAHGSAFKSLVESTGQTLDELRQGSS